MQLLAVIELFPTRTLGAFCVALGVACVAVAVGCILSEQLQRWASGLAAKFLALSPIGKVAFLLFVCVFVVYGGGKNVLTNRGEAASSPLVGMWNLPFGTSGEDAASPLIAPTADIAQVWQPFGENVVRAEVLHRCGATEDALRLTFDEGFVFPVRRGTDPCDTV